MIIYYAYIDDFYKTHSLNLSEFKSEKYAREHFLGRYMVQQIAKNEYKITDEIVLDGKKPIFKKTKNLHFSISHSGSIVAVAFDNNPVGIDIEKIKPRNYEKIAVRYNMNFSSLKSFYEWWTAYEANIKYPNGKILTFEFSDDYICSVSSPKNVNSVSLKLFNL